MTRTSHIVSILTVLVVFTIAACDSPGPTGPSSPTATGMFNLGGGSSWTDHNTDSTKWVWEGVTADGQHDTLLHWEKNCSILAAFPSYKCYGNYQKYCKHLKESHAKPPLFKYRVSHCPECSPDCFKPVWMGTQQTVVIDSVYHADSTCHVLAEFPTKKKWRSTLERMLDMGQRWNIPKCMECSAEFNPLNGR